MTKNDLSISLEQLIRENTALLKENNRLLMSIDDKLRKLVVNTSSLR
ncbi:MAG: hypothetical protein ABI361_06715 [Nitrososphaera sp.]